MLLSDHTAAVLNCMNLQRSSNILSMGVLWEISQQTAEVFNSAWSNHVLIIQDRGANQTEFLPWKGTKSGILDNHLMSWTEAIL